MTINIIQMVVYAILFYWQKQAKIHLKYHHELWKNKNYIILLKLPTYINFKIKKWSRYKTNQVRVPSLLSLLHLPYKIAMPAWYTLRWQ